MELNYRRGDINGSPKEIRVYLLNDLHFGSEAVDWDLWEKIKKDIRQNRDKARILINGDIIEGVTRSSKGDIYKQRISPEEQVELAVKEFEEFKDLIDGITSGNHDQRIMNETSFDPIKVFAKDLGILDKYLGYEGVIGYGWNKCFYSIQMFHGSGGAVTPTAIINRMNKIRKTNCDVVYIGHHHIQLEHPFIEYNIDSHNNSLQKRKRYLICGNTITKFAEYAKKFGYEEKFSSQAVLTMSGNRNKKGITVEWITN